MSFVAVSIPASALVAYSARNQPQSKRVSESVKNEAFKSEPFKSEPYKPSEPMDVSAMVAPFMQIIAQSTIQSGGFE